MTKIVPVVCPGCNNRIYGKAIDNVILCPGCQTLHMRNGVVSVLEYDAGAFTRQGDGERVYLPFWKLGVDFKVHRSRVEGGSISRFMDFLSGGSGTGNVSMILPAFEMDGVRYKELAKKLTMEGANYSQARIDPSVKREICSISVDMVENMADFLFVTIEAEKPGVLQQLDYDLRVTSKKLLYLPYYRNGNDLVPGY